MKRDEGIHSQISKRHRKKKVTIKGEEISKKGNKYDQEYSPLHIAAMEGDFDEVEKRIACLEYHIDLAGNWNNSTPLMLVSYVVKQPARDCNWMFYSKLYRYVNSIYLQTYHRLRNGTI